MRIQSKTIIAISVIALSVTACGLPRSGPSRSEIQQGSIEKRGDAVIVPVTPSVVRGTEIRETFGFPNTFMTAGSLNTDVIRKGDVLTLTVYENIEKGILGAAGSASTISSLTVDEEGKIFVPYVGRVKANGKSIEDLRMELTEQLGNQTPDPQVQLTRADGQGSSVTVIGDGAQGVVPLNSTTKKLSGLLATIGSASSTDSEATLVTIQRGRESGRIWLDDLFAERSNDINLRPGDRVTVTNDRREYIIMGEAGQGLKTFSKAEMSALDVLSSSGGVSSSSGDPKGVFVLRTERSDIADGYYENPSEKKSDRVIYLLDLVQPNGLFLARDFQIRPDDVIYVSEAPYSKLTKTVSLLLGSVAQGNQVADAVDGL